LIAAAVGRIRLAGYATGGMDTEPYFWLFENGHTNLEKNKRDVKGEIKNGLKIV
jgi:hypothetical protein